MEIDADVGFQRRVWAVQRIGWFFFAVLIVTALLGFFGSGPASRAAVQGSGLEVEYERFARFQNRTKIRLAFFTTGETKVQLSRGYLDSVEIEQVAPEPIAVEVADDWLIYQFSGRGHVIVTFHLKPERLGSLAGQARLAEIQPVEFHQFIYP